MGPWPPERRVMINVNSWSSTLLLPFTRFRRNRDGSVAVEFSIVVLPFLALTWAILELGLVFFAGQALETGVENASRLIKTGQAQQAGYDEAAFKSAICEYAEAFLDCAGKLHVDVRTASTFDDIDLSKPISNGVLDTSGFGYEPGGSGSIVIVRAFYEWPTFGRLLGLDLSSTANNKHLLIAVDAFRNEPFPW